MVEPHDRLDSWKAIADYLGRDVRTVRRWEGQGLPVSRVSGLRGNSVFAFKSEIDEWMKSHANRQPQAVPIDKPVPAVPAPVAVPGPRRRGARPVAAAGIILTVLLGWKAFAPTAARQTLSVELSEAALVARDGKGTEQWRFDFPPGIRHVLAQDGSRAEMVGGSVPAVYAGVAFLLRRPDEFPMSGVLRSFSIDGQPQAKFAPDDVWTFGGEQFSAPWAITDFRVNDAFGRRQIAVAVHHYKWWPSFVTVLDERLQRIGTFVNSGWAESVRWISPDQLAISGFNEALDGGMFGVLNTHDLDGASPEAAGSKFECISCRSGRPTFYAVFPRSEVNRVGGGPFNRALIQVSPGGFTIHTSEDKQEPNAGLVEAIYEFSEDFRLLNTSYGSRYWDRHRALELEGKLSHSRQECPERDGPRSIKTWTRDRGWTEVKPLG